MFLCPLSLSRKAMLEDIAVLTYPKASDMSSPPCLLRLLPAGAVAGWDLHPLEKRRLLTAHAPSRHCPRALAKCSIDVRIGASKPAETSASCRAMTRSELEPSGSP